MKAQGKIYLINDTQNISEKFKKREFVLEMSNNPAYVQKVLFTLILDNVDLIEGFNVGDDVEVTYNLQGKEWNSPAGETKFFNTLAVTGVNYTDNNETPKSEQEEGLKTRVDDGDDDDLPF
jgi:hypothetical protein